MFRVGLCHSTNIPVVSTSTSKISWFSVPITVNSWNYFTILFNYLKIKILIKLNEFKIYDDNKYK